MTSWFETAFSEMLNPKLAHERIERERAAERENIKKRLGVLKRKLITTEKTLKREQQTYLLKMQKYQQSKDIRNYRKNIILFKQCDAKLDILSKIIINVENQILNVKTGESLLDASRVIDGCDDYFKNLFTNITPDIVEDKILNNGDKEVVVSEMETIMSTPHSNGTLSAFEEDEELFKFADSILGSPPPSSGSGEVGITNPTMISIEGSFPSIPSSSSSLSINDSYKLKTKSKKKKKLADMNIF